MADTGATGAVSGPPGLFDLSGGLPHWAREGESFELALSLGGQYAGTQQWSIRPERGAVVARVETEFGGVLPNLRVHQTSRLHPRTLALLAYAEGEGNRTTLELSLDYRAGELRLRQRGEETDAPLVADYLDPVSLLLWVREWQAAPGEQRVVRLAGSGVHVRRLPDEAVGSAAAEVFLLRPGSAGVWRSAQSPQPAQPRTFLRLTQPTPFGMVDAQPAELWSGRAGTHSGQAGGRVRRRVG
ncbi:hypothetical protein [Deinococcus sp. SL84]|uniref:hypothetical protein n=1 Tax=Deinococcus sp. SL84 TaxID=2994663 RepID=UPI002276DB1B|nr:hypothetical protein [Deinococcus sp. SL84]MCY1703033.1 hypothetical protein [Deinococcus sp. SL84]